MKFEGTIWGVDNSVMYFERIPQIELMRLKRESLCKQAIGSNWNDWRKFEFQPPQRPQITVPSKGESRGVVVPSNLKLTSFPPPNMSMSDEIFRHKIQQLDKAILIQQMEEQREETVRRSQHHDQKRRYHNNGRIGSGRFLRRKPF